MEPSSGKARPGRSRAACSACRAVKQKCDGASTANGNCRRCAVYGLECDFSGTVTTSRPHHAPAPPLAAPSTPSVAPPARPSNFIPPTLKQTDPSVAAALREITERLRTIETGLEADRRAGRRAYPSASTAADVESAFARASSAGDHRQAHANHTINSNVEMPAESNPLQVLEQTIEKIEAMSVETSPPDWRGEDTADGASPDANKGKEAALPCPPPDAIVRNLVSIADCEAAFAFFHERIQPWISIMGNPDDRVPMLVHTRSPFLFHAILLVTNYYNTSTSERAREVYRGLCDITNTLLAHAILAPDPSKTNSDLVRGLVLLLYYKPVQHCALQSRGVTESGRLHHLSKVNALSSMMLHCLIHRTAELVGLPRAPSAFLAAIASSTAPPSLQILSDLRVHYWLCVADIHGSLQSGRASASDPTAALQTTRLFAALKNQPCDPRRAATLELYAIVRTPKGARNATKLRLDDLGRINDELDDWEEYWKPILTEAQHNGDPLAYSVLQNMANFVTFTVNSAVFTRWTIERQKSLDEGGNGRPKLTSADWACLQRAIDAAQKTVFAVSIESTMDDAPLRGCRWPEFDPTKRPPLRLDPRAVEDYRTALDTMTCISFISSLILLVRMTSSGLSSCDLACKRSDYEAGAAIGVAQLLQGACKLPRLLELGAAFLFAVAPNRHHPARKHSVLVQMILKAGLGENTPHVSASDGSPGTINLDPSPSSNEPQPAATAAAVNPLPPLPPLPLQQEQRTTNTGSPSTPDSWMWNAATPGLPLSSDGGALLIPSMPEFSATQGSNPMTNILSSGDNPFFSNYYSTNAGAEIPGLTDDLAFSAMLGMDGLDGSMDWGVDSTVA